MTNTFSIPLRRLVATALVALVPAVSEAQTENDYYSEADRGLDIAFVGSPTILNDGAENDALRLRIANIAEYLDESNTFRVVGDPDASCSNPIPSCGYQGATTFVVSFDAETAPGSGAYAHQWALARADETTGLAMRDIPGFLTCRPNPAAGETKWRFIARQDVSLASGQFRDFEIQMPKTTAPSGFTKMVFKYYGLRDDSGDALCGAVPGLKIEKAPMVFRDGRVGVGTLPDPKFKVDVEGKTRARGVVSQEGQDGRSVALSTMSVLFNKERSGSSEYDQAYISFGTDRNMSIDTYTPQNPEGGHLMLLSANDNYVGIGSFPPEAKLDVNGNALVRSGIEVRGPAALKKGVIVDGVVVARGGVNVEGSNSLRLEQGDWSWVYNDSQGNLQLDGGQRTVSVRGSAIDLAANTNVRGALSVNSETLDAYIDRRIKSFIQTRCTIYLGWKDACETCKEYPSRYQGIKLDGTGCTGEGDQRFCIGGWAAIGFSGGMDGNETIFVNMHCD